MTRQSEYSANRQLSETRITRKPYPRVRDRKLSLALIVVAIYGLICWWVMEKFLPL